MRSNEMVDQQSDLGFLLEDIQVLPSHNTLTAKGRTITLQPKVMAVLHYLALHQHRVISNQELLDHVWEGRVVTQGSVQKSMNSLRSALAELCGDREVIVHYSKRGYQLQITPEFSVPQTVLPHIQHNSNAVFTKQMRFVAGLFVVVLVMSILIYFWQIPRLPAVIQKHKTEFHTMVGYTNETGHERNATPHPDNKHIAYVRERFSSENPNATLSEIVIRDAEGLDWRVIETQGSWFKMAWSPEGKHLVAIEVKRLNDRPVTPGFYEKPNYIYSFHIFSLDLEQNRLIEKQLLSQWQGRIFSVTWWDEETLEFIAKQGSDTASMRFRYSLLNQTLLVLDDIDGVVNPIASVIHNQITALVAAQKNSYQVYFLDKDQTILRQWKLQTNTAEISWIPDGSGVLLYSEANRKMNLLYLNGKQIEIPVADVKDKVLSRPYFRPDGDGIYYTEEKRNSNIMQFGLDGISSQLTKNDNFNYSASFSPDGQEVVYASVRNNQIHLWLVQNGQELQLTKIPLQQKINHIVWSTNGDSLLFVSGLKLYSYDFKSAQLNLVLTEKDKIEPIGYNLQTHHLFMIKNHNDVRNLWKIDLETNQEKQLTFGSVGSAISNGETVFFQYTDEQGLWSVDPNGNVQRVTSNLPEHIKLLKVDKGGAYFIEGGMCRESDIQYLSLSEQTVTLYLKRDKTLVMTTAFHPNKGVLYTDCYLAEANIMLMK